MRLMTLYRLPTSAAKRAATTCSRPEPWHSAVAESESIACLIAGQRSRDELQVDRFEHHVVLAPTTCSSSPVSAGIVPVASRGPLRAAAFCHRPARKRAMRGFRVDQTGRQC